MEKEFKEAIAWLEDGFDIVLICDGYEYELMQADSYLGSEGQDGYISQVMGNIIYKNAQDALQESIKHLTAKEYDVRIRLQ